MSEPIDVSQLPDLSVMTDEQIDDFASKLWESIPQAELPIEPDNK